MLTLPSSVRVYLAAEPVDLRRGHDGLVAIVRATWRLNPFDGHLFVFLGKRLPRGAERVEMDATMGTIVEKRGVSIAGSAIARPHGTRPRGACSRAAARRAA